MNEVKKKTKKKKNTAKKTNRRFLSIATFVLNSQKNKIHRFHFNKCQPCFACTYFVNEIKKLCYSDL